MKTPIVIGLCIAVALALGSAAGFAIATWKSDSLTSVSSTSSSTKTPQPPQSNTGGQPQQNMSGPWNRDLHIMFGDSFEDLSEPKTFVERAGVPTLVERADGSLLSAFQWFPEDNDDAFDEVAVSMSTDGGETWSDPEPIVVEGFPEAYQRPFDPTLVVRDDGSVYMYFTTSTTDMKSPDTETIISVASSTDGINYTYLGDAFTMDGVRLYDAAVVEFEETWYMGTPRKNEDGQYAGSSVDGFLFESIGAFTNGETTNWIGNYALHDGTIYFLGTPSPQTGEKTWYVTSEDMKVWSDATELDLQVGDPAALYRSDSGWIVIGVSQEVRNESGPSEKR